MTEIRVVLVDDQELVRAGLAMVIDSQPDLRVVAQASSGPQVLRLLDQTSCHVVLMDVRMPGMDGIETAAALLAEAERRPGIPPRVVMLTTYDLDEYLLRAIRAGASGFLLKNAPPEELLAAIRTVHNGDGVVAPSATRRLLEHVATAPASQPDPRLARLTERETEVLQLIAQGTSNAEISEQLYLSATTVKTHVRHIMAKLEARDRVQLVVLAYESGVARPGGSLDQNGSADATPR